MRIVVTGALGHIGSRLIRELPSLLSHSGAAPEVVPEVVMVDSLTSQRYSSLFHLPKGARYTFFEGGLETEPLEGILEGADAVVHLGAATNAAHSAYSAQFSAGLIPVNLSTTTRVARQCAEQKVPLLFLSTTSVYGTRHPLVDEDCPAEDLSPQSPYAETKLREEETLAGLHRSDGLRYTVLRAATVFGFSPGMSFHTAVSKFCWQASLGRPVTVWRTALDQIRPYLDLGDAVRAIGFVLREREFSGNTFNVLTLHTTVRHILSLIRARLPELEISFVDESVMNDLSFEVSPCRALARGFEFRGDLRRGIAETLEALSALRGGEADARSSIPDRIEPGVDSLLRAIPAGWTAGWGI